MNEQPVGMLYDIGYQRYMGPREGRSRAFKALMVNGIRTILGLGRGSRSKILPILFFTLVMMPAVVMTIIVSVTNAGNLLPGYADYYQVVAMILLIFSAVMAPELLCPDRRERVLDLYLVRPITPVEYVAGRWTSFLAITLALVYSGQIVLLIGLVLAADNPWNYLLDNWLDIPRFLAAGLLLALYTTNIPMAVAAFTSRRAYAAAIVIGVFIISASVAGALTSPGGPISESAARWFALLNIGMVPIHISDMIFNKDNTSQIPMLVAELPVIIPIAWYTLITAGSGFLLWWRYRRMAA